MPTIRIKELAYRVELLCKIITDKKLEIGTAISETESRYLKSLDADCKQLKKEIVQLKRIQSKPLTA